MRKALKVGNIWKHRSNKDLYVMKRVRKYGMGVYGIDLVNSKGSGDAFTPGNYAGISKAELRESFTFYQSAASYEAELAAKIRGKAAKAAEESRKRLDERERVAARVLADAIANETPVQRAYRSLSNAQRALARSRAGFPYNYTSYLLASTRVAEASAQVEEAKREELKARYSKALFVDSFYGRDKFTPANIYFDVNTIGRGVVTPEPMPLDYLGKWYSDTDSAHTPKEKENTMTEIKIGNIYKPRNDGPNGPRYTVTKRTADGVVTIRGEFPKFGRQSALTGEFEYTRAGRERMFTGPNSELVLEKERKAYRPATGDTFTMRSTGEEIRVVDNGEYRCNSCSAMAGKNVSHNKGVRLARGGMLFTGLKGLEYVQDRIDVGAWTLNDRKAARPEAVKPQKTEPLQFVKTLTVHALEYNANKPTKITRIQVAEDPTIGDKGELVIKPLDGGKTVIADGEWIEFSLSK